IKELEEKYKNKGYADFKKDLAQVVIDFLKPFQIKRKELESKTDYVEKIIRVGSEKAKGEAKKTIREVKERIGLE
ncbi:MAG: tryptophan--tRNA ligase, partial [Parcubacteria group bacterium]|nr:tryptophan--tRNA ligase [Parcubacteria group bacterium]